jgi:class 3 adenylate cyclase/tetratricopeptide (TPR) repeat protein
MRCLSCKTDNAESAQFCMRCGTQLDRQAPAGPAERRQITVLFCDLVGSTALSEELDPEDLRDVIQRYHAMCDAVVARYDASIAQHLGDGVLVYFGHPRAHEDDTVRAVRAGLELRKTVADLRVRGRPMAVRVGIHTGVVVVGAIGAEARQLALGATPNLAARIQQEAEPDTVVISDASQKLVFGFFHVTDLGSRTMRGVSQPVRLYRVERETGARSRMEATAASLTPFVGREKEMVLVVERWADALAGKAPVVTVCGDPGIGKSRLIRSLRAHVGADAVVVECFASPLFQDTALYPVVEMLERQFGTAKETATSRRAKLRALLEQANIATPTTMDPIAALLSIAPDEAQTATLSPQKQRLATFDALASWVRAAAEKQPVLFVLEDLHWADPSTIELVGLLIERLSIGRLMMVLTHRPEFVPPFASPRLTQITLQRMPHDEARKILAALSANRQLPEAVEREVLAKADGVPLYVEEIAKAVLESRDAPGMSDEAGGPVPSRGGFTIPATVVDSLTARLDRLGDGKRIIQLAATLGRTFALGVLLEVAGTPETALRSQLGRLEEAGLLLRKDQPPDDSYIFKHALIQDAAYASLLRSTRQEYHRQIAHVLEERFPSVAASQPELLARHFSGASAPVEAIKYWTLAGQNAFARSANAEAISAFGNALHLLPSLPASKERDYQEIELRRGLGLALIFIKGWSTKEVEDTYGPALELCRQYGDVPIRVLYGLWAVYVVRADRERTAELTEMVEHTLRHSKDQQDLFIAHGLLGGHAFWTADYLKASYHTDAGATHIDRANPRQQALMLLAQGYDGQVYPLLFRAWTAIVQARARDAIVACKEAIEIGVASEHPYTLTLALSYAAAVAHDMGDLEEVEARAQRLSAIATDNGFTWFAVNAQSFLGWVALKRGQPERGVEMMQQAVQVYQAVGSDLILAYYLSLLAAGYAVLGRVDEGLAAVDQGLRVTKAKLAVFAEPELHRLKGELEILKGDAERGEQSLRTARTLAESQAAILFEARASLSLGRLWAEQGRGAEAAEMLRTSLSRIGSDEPLPERTDLLNLVKQVGAAS